LRRNRASLVQVDPVQLVQQGEVEASSKDSIWINSTTLSRPLR
jgi:hypothetical protein